MYVISILLDLLKFVLWPRMWSTLVYLLYELEKDVYFSEWNILYVNYIALIKTPFRSMIYLLIFLPAWSITKRWVLKSPAIIEDKCISLHCSISFVSHFWCSAVWCIHIKDCIFLERWPLYDYVRLLFIWGNFPYSEISFASN